MTERTDRALAVAAGIMLAISPPADALLRETPARFTVNLSNSGNRTVQITKLTFEGWGVVVPLEAADLYPVLTGDHYSRCTGDASEGTDNCPESGASL